MTFFTKRKTVYSFIIIVYSVLLSVAFIPRAISQNNLPPTDGHVISLAGIWKFKLDPLDIGIQQRGVKTEQPLPNVILLPGSTDQAGYGARDNTISSLRLTRLFPYKGVAWYQKEIFVPADWKSKTICLFLERAHWQTKVWVNGKLSGENASLAVPHIYNVTPLIKAGQMNKIRIRVDNNNIYDIGSPHAISEETQTNWNGIIGKIQLRAFDKVHIKEVQVYPDVDHKQAKVKIVVENDKKQDIEGSLKLTTSFIDKNTSKVTSLKHIEFSGKDSLIVINTILSFGKKMKLWDEFHPNLYQLKVEMNAGGRYQSVDSVKFGMRDFTTNGTQFFINGRPTFIRSNVNSAEFPVTGYPPMEIRQWIHIFTTCKEYGLNAMRFHSWCPPEAAFEAADKMGFYLQVENADWRFNIGEDSAASKFLAKEADRILKTYGNHPSFTMFCEGNELAGPKVDSFLTTLIRHWKKEDPRHLYTGSSGYPVIANDDYIDLYGPRAQHWREGLKGRINAEPYHTNFDYSKIVAKYDKPVISHEVGQWCVYPDFSQIPKYTGTLKPYNYALFRESLRDHHMLDQAKQFMMASGKFQVIQKKEELEGLLRTPGLGGYELLELQDYPGQGTAPVGVVDDFWDPKPYVTTKEFREFQASRVLLLRSPAFIFTNNQIFQATVEMANYGEQEMKNTIIHWELKFPDGKIYKEGDLGKINIPIGSPFLLGKLSIPLHNIGKATRLDLRLSVKHSNITNHWSIWVYPEKLPDVTSKKFVIAHNWDEKVKNVLQNGGRVLLLADTSKINSELSASFSGISWNTVWSGTPPDKLGILCNPKDSALQYFPTQYYSNWQWWDIVRHSRPMKMNDFPSTFKPIVQMIPDWNKNNKIGLIFEARVGDGKLLVTSIDLVHDMANRPVARQMLYSLKKYVSGKNFNPKIEIPSNLIDQLFKK
ncbi:MAG: glycoside hydrolase family 2 [Acidobacterium ailaaui]|nr:glycoside hydrolase family 2 [Pseudacidobacterium ailaaui]